MLLEVRGLLPWNGGLRNEEFALDILISAGFNGAAGTLQKSKNS